MRSKYCRTTKSNSPPNRKSESSSDSRSETGRIKSVTTVVVFEGARQKAPNKPPSMESFKPSVSSSSDSSSTENNLCQNKQKVISTLQNFNKEWSKAEDRFLTHTAHEFIDFYEVRNPVLLEKSKTAIQSVKLYFGGTYNISKKLLKLSHNVGKCPLATREPLSQYCHLQVSQWAGELLTLLERQQSLTYVDICVVIINVVNLHQYVVTLSPLVAEEFGLVLQHFVCALAPLMLTLEVLSGVEPIDYTRVVSESVNKARAQLCVNALFKDSSMKLLPTISDFSDGDLVSRSIFCSIYKSTYKPINMPCILKCTDITMFPHPNFSLNNRVSASVLHHNNLMAFLCCIPFETVVVSVLEYIHGYSLQLALHQCGQLTCAEIRLIISQVIAGVLHMHLKGIIHRDIKPGNAIISHGGRVKLTGFYTSKIGRGHYSQAIIKCFYARSAGEFCESEETGTLSYMAPEVLQAVGFGRACDMWSVGVTLYRLLFGMLPFRQTDTDALKEAILSCKPEFPDLSRTESGLSECVDMTRKLLRRQPDLRLGSTSHNEIVKHEFFNDFNWQSLTQKAVLPLTSLSGLNMNSLDAAASVIESFEKTSVVRFADLPRLNANRDPINCYLSPYMREVIIKKLAVPIDPSAYVYEDPTSKCDLSPYHRCRKTDDLPRSEVEIFTILIYRVDLNVRIGLDLQTTKSESGDLYYFVGRISKNTAAWESHLLEGDIVLTISGASIVGAPKSKVVSSLSSCKGDVSLGVLISNPIRLASLPTTFVSYTKQLSEIRLQVQRSRGLFSNSSAIDFSARYFNFNDPDLKDFVSICLIDFVNLNCTVGVFMGDVLVEVNSQRNDLKTKLAYELASKSTTPFSISILPTSALRKSRLRFDRLLHQIAERF